MKIQLYICAIFLFFSCGSHNKKVKYNMPKFNSIKELKAEIINDSHLFQYAQYAMLYDSLLLFSDITQGKVIHMFNRKNGEFITSFATKGNGPGEIVTPSTITIDRKRGEIKVNDFAKKTIVSYNLNSLLENNEVYYTSIRLGDSLSNCYYMRFVKDSLYIANGYDSHLILSSSSKVVSTLSNTEIDYNLFENNKEWNQFMEHATGAASPNGNLYVEGSLIGGIMNLYDISSDQISERKILNFFKPVFDDKKRATAETIYGFCCFSTSDSYIYALVHVKANPTSMPKTIWKFDWNGNPIAVYECDYSIESFVVSEDNNEFYASIYLDDGRQAIAKYRF